MIPADARGHRSADDQGDGQPKRALAGAGAGLDRVVFVRIFLTNFERDYAAVNEIYKTYFDAAALPGRTTVGVTHLARGGIVEIDLIARR